MLTAPLIFAALSAGFIGGVHCVGMCGGIAHLLSRKAIVANPRRVIPIAYEPPTSTQQSNAQNPIVYNIALHAGRIFTYVLAGAVLGAFGAASLTLRPYLPIQQALFVIGNISLVLLGLRLLGWVPHFFFIPSLIEWISKLTSNISPFMQHHKTSPFMVGMLWGCLPCGLLFVIAPLALLSGDAISGAALMLLFGLSALPHLLIAQRLAAMRYSVGGRGLKLVAAMVLLAVGVFGLFHSDMKSMPEWLCVTATL